MKSFKTCARLAENHGLDRGITRTNFTNGNVLIAFAMLKSTVCEHYQNEIGVVKADTGFRAFMGTSLAVRLAGLGEQLAVPAPAGGAWDKSTSQALSVC